MRLRWLPSQATPVDVWQPVLKNDAPPGGLRKSLWQPKADGIVGSTIDCDCVIDRQRRFLPAARWRWCSLMILPSSSYRRHPAAPFGADLFCHQRELSVNSSVSNSFNRQ
jgi:hypothetical protein